MLCLIDFVAELVEGAQPQGGDGEGQRQEAGDGDGDCISDRDEVIACLCSLHTDHFFIGGGRGRRGRRGRRKGAGGRGGAGDRPDNR